MTPYTLIVDDFLEDFAAARAQLLALDYPVEQPNPIDRYVYPHTALLPDAWQIERKLSIILGARAVMRLLVARLSPEDARCPEQAHSDLTIVSPPAAYTMILYMNEQADCRGGTELLRHSPTGAYRGDDPIQDWQADKNDQSCWKTVLSVPMQENRAVIFPSCLIHRSMPIGGFGQDVNDGRLVVVALLNLLGS